MMVVAVLIVVTVLMVMTVVVELNYCQTPDLPNSKVQPSIEKSGRLYIWVVDWLVVCRY